MMSEKPSREEQLQGIRDAIAGNGAPGVHDRYSAAGRKPPDPETMCLVCEGMGFYPTKNKTQWPKNAVPDVIGYVFITCDRCNGSGLRVGQG